MTQPPRPKAHIHGANDPFDAIAKLIAQLTRAINQAIPVGTLIASASSDTPPGYLFCDGSGVDRTDYDALFATIGVAYGNGNGSTTFNLPKLDSGYFVQGTTPGATGSFGATGTAYTKLGVAWYIKF